MWIDPNLHVHHRIGLDDDGIVKGIVEMVPEISTSGERVLSHARHVHAVVISHAHVFVIHVDVLARDDGIFPPEENEMKTSTRKTHPSSSNPHIT